MISKREVVQAVRRKYLRQMIKDSKAINVNMKEAKSAVNNENGVVSASAMIEYYNTLYKIGQNSKDRLPDESDNTYQHSANDIVMQLLLLNSK